MDIIPYSALFAFFGGIMFAAVLARFMPHSRIPKVGTVWTIKLMALTAFLFWSTWIIPQVVLLYIMARPLTVTLLLTLIFALFMLGAVIATYIVGKRGHFDA